MFDIKAGWGKLNQPAFIPNMAEPHIPVKVNNLHCQICTEVFRNPATIPCGHTFCMQCIQDCWEHHEMNSRLCSCPECGDMFPSRPQLSTNATLAEMVRDTHRSDDKKRKQQNLGESQPELKKCRSSTETSGSTLCLGHNKPLANYCCTDEQIICSQCTSDEHQGHRMGSVTEERRRKQEELRNLQTKFKQILQKQDQTTANMKEMLQQIEEEARQTEDDCESTIVGVIGSLQRHFLSLKEQIRAQEKEAAAQVHDSLQNLMVKRKEMMKRDAEMDQLAQAQSNIYFLQKWPSLRVPCEEDLLNHLNMGSEDPLQPFEFTKKAVEQLGKQLEEFCDKKFASISQTSLSRVYRTLTEQNVEPKTREDFLQYACELSLDFTTAHEDLVISDGDKDVTLCPQKWKNPEKVPQRFSQRFSFCRQVLCREGLQAERCYFEVEVEGDKADIALAYKRIDRKSKTKLSAFGCNANSWSLDRSKDYRVSHKSESIKLTAPPSHPRIGVYLKFKEGTLTFYEVSDSMKLLHTIEAEFTEPLYAGFWLGEKCCIRICDLTQNRL